MAAINETINPGDVISSELMRKIIELINAHDAALSGGGGGGGVTVPNLFGRPLSEAKVSLQLQQLALGTVVDAGGSIINPASTSSGSLMVLNQVPVAGSKTVAGGAVNLVVAGSAGGTAPPPPPTPVVTLLVPTSVRAGGSLEIRGSGFAGATCTVTLGGINATVLGTSNISRLYVTVPSGIPGAPTLPGGPAASDIELRVVNPGGLSTTSSVTVLPPLANPLAITAITPNPVTVGKPVTITGTGFATTANQQSVSFGGVAATPSAATATQLTVTVPAGIPGLVAPGDSTTVNVTVTRVSDNVTSGALPLSVDL